MNVDDRFKGYIRDYNESIVNVEEKPKPKIDKEEWVQKVNNHPGVKSNNLKVVNSGNYTFLKFLVAILLLAMCIIGGLFIFYVKEGQFKPTISQTIPINPQFNNTADITLQAPISNQITLNPNTPIYLNVSIHIDKLITNST